MQIARYLLLAGSGGGAVFFLFIIATERLYGNQLPIMLGVVAALVVNFIYIFNSTPPSENPSRAARMWRLWLDAKENELKARASKSN